jgi:hypothetical protein
MLDEDEHGGCVERILKYWEKSLSQCRSVHYKSSEITLGSRTDVAVTT